MSHSQEPSYYEIALTNRQVLGFFVVLLLCVVGAFFSGIWLGKKQVGEVAMLEPQGPTVEQAESTDEPLEELNFFTDDVSEAGRQAPPAAEPQRPARRPETQSETQLSAAASSTTTLREDVEAAAPPQVQRVEPPPREEELVASEPIVREPASTPRPAAGGFVIQVFASEDAQQARRLLNRLQAAGYQAFIVENAGDALHRVRIGPFADRREAERLEPRLKADFKVDTWVTSHE